MTFFNWTQQDIELTWNKVPFLVKAGELLRDVANSPHGTVILQEGIVNAWAHHVAIREMDRQGVEHGNMGVYEKFKGFCKSESISQEELDNLRPKAPKKMGRPPKEKVEESA